MKNWKKGFETINLNSENIKKKVPAKSLQYISISLTVLIILSLIGGIIGLTLTKKGNQSNENLIEKNLFTSTDSSIIMTTLLKYITNKPFIQHKEEDREIIPEEIIQDRLVTEQKYMEHLRTYSEEDLVGKPNDLLGNLPDIDALEKLYSKEETVVERKDNNETDPLYVDNTNGESNGRLFDNSKWIVA
ncbi:hypothetical protein SNEBB_006503 [Seison nebaliae]|nr:hypothetical protein SNEBB_006503 [Seison nebaliae]